MLGTWRVKRSYLGIKQWIKRCEPHFDEVFPH
jgi:hypothetical protein